MIAATGYIVDLERLKFLSPEIRSQVKTVNGSPVLSSSFESSVPGLYFVGVAAANSFGPVMRFAFGAGFAARRLHQAMAEGAGQSRASVRGSERRDHREVKSQLPSSGLERLMRRMKRETIAIHAGYDGDPTTKAVAVPIYQTVAFEFDSAEHGAALFNLEVEGNIYTRIGNPTNTVLEKRVAALEGGVDGLSVSSGMAAIEYSLINIAEAGNNIVSTPQLYGATYTLLAHIFPKRGITSRFAATDRPEDVEKLIDENTRAVYCESVGNPAGNVADIEGLARVAHKHGVPLVVDNTVATPILLRPIEYGADVVVHSMTKFIGGGGTSIGGMIVDGGKFPVAEVSGKVLHVQPAGDRLSRRGLCRSLRGRGICRALPDGLPEKHRRDAISV